MRYTPYNKQLIIASMIRRDKSLSGQTAAGKKPSILEFSKWPQWWEEGAKELEKTAPGRLITAPIRLPEALVTATTKTVQEVPNVVKKISGAVPLIAIAAVVLGAGYAAYKFNLFRKPENANMGECQ